LDFGFHMAVEPLPGRRHERAPPTAGLLAEPRQDGPGVGGIVIHTPQESKQS
jgi:hypothetical protein